jgi:L-amino acid N-acyltransferase YncA
VDGTARVRRTGRSENRLSPARIDMHRLADFIKGVKSDGIEYLLDGVASRFPDWLLKYAHTHLTTARDLRLISREYDEYVVRAATPDDAAQIERAGVSREVALERFARGDTCVAVFKGDRLVSLCWAAVGELYDDGGFWVDTGPDGFFLYGVYTEPEERLRGLFHATYRRVQAELRAAGRSRIFSSVAHHNRAAIRSHRRMGFELIGEVFLLTIAGINLNYFKSWPTDVPRWSVSVKPRLTKVKWV